MDNFGDKSRLRTISTASTGSLYGEEFIGVARQDRSIDEVCRKMSEATVDGLDAFAREERLEESLARIPKPEPDNGNWSGPQFDPFLGAQNDDPAKNPIQNRDSGTGRSASVSSITGRNRVPSCFSDVLNMLMDDCPSPSTTGGYNISSPSVSGLNVGMPPSLAGLNGGVSSSSTTGLGAGAQTPSAPLGSDSASVRSREFESLTSTQTPLNGSAMSVIAARSTSVGSLGLSSSSKLQTPPSARSRRLSSVPLIPTPAVSTDDISLSGFLNVSNSSGGRARAASGGKQLFAAAMNQRGGDETVFRGNPRAPKTGTAAWTAASNQHSLLHTKRSRSASLASSAVATEKKMQSNSASQHHSRSFQANMRLGRWTEQEQLLLREAINRYGPDPKWRDIAAFVGTRTGPQCSQHWHRNLAPNIAPRRRGAWIPEEDETLRKLISEFGSRGPWPRIAQKMHQTGFQRTDKQCRERWQHHLDPSLRVGAFSQQEDAVLLQTYRECGDKWNWKRMKAALPGRTRDQVKRRLSALQRLRSKHA